MKRWGRLLGACYLLAIFGSSLFAAHRHLNPIGDLLTDGPSDSGTFLRAVSPSNGKGAALSGFVFVDDDPCLACFWHDFLAFATIRYSLDVPVSILPYAPNSRAPGFLSAPEKRPVIRGPPTSSV